MTERCQLLYLSRLAADSSPACVAEIVRAARPQNKARRISSLLVFDGWRFCQYLEGDAAAVCALADRIRVDPRHTDFRQLHQGVFTGPPLLGGRSLVYALSYDDSLDGVEEARGPEAVALLAGLLPALDREPEFHGM
ncbi:MAG: BLUF domain-containing protein [Thiobacillus sp.]|nr:BLUF domain-containing protein [Thiobacillus sp.]